jgi:large subunit ribosomal protein L25
VGEGVSPGLKRGGVLNVVRHTIDVWADPEHIPEYLEADLSALDINDNVRWHDLKGTENLRPTVARDFVVATIAAPTKMAESPAEAGQAAAAAAPAKGKPAPAKAPAKPAARK